MTASKRDTTVRLGVRGWDRPGWREAFYPAGMPEDWQLTFFNTQFGCVFLDEDVWKRVDSDLWARWCADTHDDFVFLLGGDAGMAPPEGLADKAIVLPQDDRRIVWFDRNTDLKVLAEELRRRDVAGPRFVLSRDGDLAQLERVATLLELMGL